MGNGQAQHADLTRRAGVTIGGEGVLLSGHSFTLPGAGTLNYLYQTGAGTTAAIGLNTYGPGLPMPRTLVSQRQRGQIAIAEHGDDGHRHVDACRTGCLVFCTTDPRRDHGRCPAGRQHRERRDQGGRQFSGLSHERTRGREVCHL